MSDKKTMQTILLLLVLCLSLSVSGFANNYDLGGRTITFAIYFPTMTPFGTPYDTYNWLEPDARLQAHITAVEEMFNCKIEFFHTSFDYLKVEPIAAQVLTGETEFQVVQVNSAVMEELAANGLLHDLDGIIDQSFLASLPPTFRRTSGTQFRGVTYAFEGMNIGLESQGIYWNMDKFEEQGFPNLYELYEAGEWTWDVFRDIAVAATKDTTGDGEIDQFGITHFWGMRYHWSAHYMAYWMLTNDAQLTRVVDGNVVVAFDEPAAMETMEFLQQLYQDIPSMEKSSARDGSDMMTLALAQGMHYGSWFPQITDNYGFVPMPLGPQGSEYVLPDWNRWVNAIPITEQNPEALVEVTKALWKLTEEYMDVDLDTWEEQYWNVRHAFAARDRETIKNWRENASKTIIPPLVNIIRDAGLGQAAADIIFDGASPQARIAEVKPQVQAVLDELINR